MKFSINTRSAILYSVYFLCACNVSLNAQTIDIDLSNAPGGTGFESLIDALDDNVELFTATPNGDGLTTQNVLTNPLEFDVEEEDGSLRLTILSATVTAGVDGPGGASTDNRASFNTSGLGLALRGPSQRIDPSRSALELGNSLARSSFRLDATYDEMLTIAFNQSVAISGIGVTNLSDGETFQFGPADDITNQDAGFTLGGLGNVDLYTFDPPLEFAAGEGILIGNTGFDPNLLAGSNTGVGFERILLTLNDTPILIGDVNQDGAVNFLDITPFIAVLSGGMLQAEADIDESGTVDFLDITPFIAILSGA